MNTGHEGSLSTLHANTPRDALRRLETMVLLAGVELPLRAIREQIASAIDLIVQLSRDAEGRRFVSSITEVVGMEGDVVSTADLFVREGEQLVSTGVTSRHFAQSAGGH
jgi:pilus assembly protein CpaF